jgi:protein required for attachment to host cells
MKKPTTWILIANGTQAHVLEHNGTGKGLTAIKGMDWSIAPLQAQDINTDRQGRGPTGGAMEARTDPARHREDEFVRTLADVMDQKAKSGAYDRLVIAAAPIALGTLRKALSDHVKKTVVAELDKDLTNLPTPQLAKHLDGIISV